MANDKRVLAVIPARGGSKRLPRKNLLPLHGKPLIAWTIEAAKQAGCIDTLMVNTDDAEIAAVAETYGAAVPFKRPEHMATDTAPTIDALLHTLDWYEKQGETFDYLILLQPTSPLRRCRHIDNAWQLLQEKQADAVISVCETEHSPLWTNTLPDNGCMANFLRPELLNQRSQDLPRHYRLNGAIYIADIRRLKEEQTFFLSSQVFAYSMEREASVDIDSRLDLMLAEQIMKVSCQPQRHDEPESHCHLSPL